MNRLINILIAAIASLAVSCTSCRDDEPVIGDTCELIVTLSAKVPDKTAGTVSRSGGTWNDPYPEQQGLPDESRITNLSLYLVNSDNQALGLPAVLVKSDKGLFQYKVKLKLNSDFVVPRPNGTYLLTGRIVALANYPGDGTQASPFDAPAFPIDYIKQSGTIPMWGVSTVTDVLITKDATVDIGRIDLLRSVPKITIRLSDDVKDLYRIKSVVPSAENFNTTAFCQPSGCLTVPFTRNLEIEGCYNESSDSKGSIKDFYTDTQLSELWFYPAERKCSADASGSPAYFTVTVQRADGSEAPFAGRVYLCDYKNGIPDFTTAFSRIVRNHNYEYVLELKELQFLISFREWVFGGKEHLELE